MAALNQASITPNHGSTRIRNSLMTTPRTPGRMKDRTQFDIRSRNSGEAPEDSDENEIIDPLAELIKLTWNIWAVSPLFGIDYSDNVKLKQYAKTLRELMASSLTQENASYTAEFEVLANLVCNRSDPPALTVKVFSQTDEADNPTCIYNAVLLSWGPRHKSESGNLKLPLLLCRGALTVTRVVHSVLAQMFDCMITAMPVSQDDVMWLTTIILNSPESVAVQKRKKKKDSLSALTLEFQIPGLPQSELTSVQLPLLSMITLWSKICPMQQSTINPNEQVASTIRLEQVQKFHECIRTQLLNKASLELGLCLLVKFSLPSFTIKGNKMKAATTDALDRVLWFFQEKALLYSPPLIPNENEN